MKSLYVTSGIFIAFIIMIPAQAVLASTQPDAAAGSMKGTNMNLSITPASFNPDTDKNVTLAFVPNSSVPTLVTGGSVKHLDYDITISKEGKPVFSQKFHTHNGDLTLVFTPSSGQISVTGGESDAANTSTGPFYISGPVFDSSGNYDITADVVGVNFNPINPLEDKFTLQAAPEFGPVAAGIAAVSMLAVVLLYRRSALPHLQ